MFRWSGDDLIDQGFDEDPEAVGQGSGGRVDGPKFASELLAETPEVPKRVVALADQVGIDQMVGPS
jgi:hypothetical protein